MTEGFTDMHCHILPGVDDGSPDMETSLRMLEREWNEGVGTVILTPHYIQRHNHYRYDELEGIFEKLKQKSGEINPQLKLFLGNEILYEPGIAESLRAGRIHTMAGSRYILIEFRVTIEEEYILKAVRECTDMGFKPIIAHVERYFCLQGNFEALEWIVRQGALLQCNTQAVTAGFTDGEGRWARKMVKGGFIRFIGTDAHDMNKRSPQYKKAYEWIRTKCGADMAKEMTRMPFELA